MSTNGEMTSQPVSEAQKAAAEEERKRQEVAAKKAKKEEDAKKKWFYWFGAPLEEAQRNYYAIALKNRFKVDSKTPPQLQRTGWTMFIVLTTA